MSSPYTSDSFKSKSPTTKKGIKKKYALVQGIE